MNILNKKLNFDEFKDYIKGKSFKPNNPNKCILHHTWKPTQKDWKGETTIQGLKKYYEGLGWNSAPHIFIAPDGIWLFTDMNTQGIHAGEGNYRSIGIEVVGNYDGAKWTGLREQTLGVIDALLNELNLGTDAIHFHRKYNTSKSCPGSAISIKWVKDKLKEYRVKKEEPQNEPVEKKEPELPKVPVEPLKPSERPVEPPGASYTAEPQIHFDKEKQVWLINKTNNMEIVKKVWGMLEGKKAVITGLLMVALGLLQGNAEMVMTGLGFIFLRMKK